MLERMLVGKIENRITVGIVCFVGMMVLLGWAAINEGGRMASLEQTYHARSIEQGAALFASNCTTCHGPDGRGLAGYGPGLNNPAFFGHDFYPEITSQVNTLNAEQLALAAERDSTTAPATEERKAEIAARLTEIESELTTLNAPRDTDLAAAIALGYDPSRPDRPQNIGWIGTHEALVLTTLIHGRPVSINYWQNGAMPAWSQTAGGPLRMDQLEDLVAYVENWDKGDAWTLDDLFAVKQFAIEPEDPRPLRELIDQLQASGGEIPVAVGTDVTAVAAEIEGLTGDAARGDALYHNQATSQLGQSLACSGCHLQSSNGTGPMVEGTFWRAENERADAGLEAEEYLVQSILQPGAYIVPGFQNLMLANFGERMTAQDLADIIAYLETMTQPQ